MAFVKRNVYETKVSVLKPTMNLFLDINVELLVGNSF